VAQALGMVNRVVPRDTLAEASLALATEIAQQPAMGLKTAKASINQAQDAQGFFNSLRSAMGLQQLAHAQNYLVHGMAVDPSGAERVKALVKAPPLGAPEKR
jgi:enoyl-CoA hydratase